MNTPTAAGSAETSRFQFQIPFVLQSPSPSLAALHASRARLLHHPDSASDVLANTHCTSCGAFLLDGSATIRSVRIPNVKRRKSRQASPTRYSRVLRKTCNACGHAQDEPIEPRAKGTAAVSTPPSSLISDVPGITKERGSQNVHPQTFSPSPTPSLPASPIPSRPSIPTSANKNIHLSKTIAGEPKIKSRPKKNRGLQDVLARNRERQAQEKKSAQPQGLSGFLQGL